MRVASGRRVLETDPKLKCGIYGTVVTFAAYPNNNGYIDKLEGRLLSCAVNIHGTKRIGSDYEKQSGWARLGAGLKDISQMSFPKLCWHYGCGLYNSSYGTTDRQFTAPTSLKI